MKFIQKSENNDNPWNRNSEQKGPPNLDDLLKKFFSGGSKNKKNSENDESFSFSPKIIVGFVSLISIGLVSIWGLSGIYTVQPAEEAAVMTFGKFTSTQGPGIHWYPRFIKTIKKINVEEINSLSLSKEMLTSEENIVSVGFTVQYRVGDIKNYLFNATSPEIILSQAMESAVRQTIGENKLEPILAAGRAKIQDDVTVEMKNLMKKYNAGLEITQVIMQPAMAPEPVKSAFDDVIKAREDNVKIINVSEGYANKIIPIAEGIAKRVLEKAEADKQKTILEADGSIARFKALLPMYKQSPSIIKNEMYFDMMTEVLGKNKVFIIEGNGDKSLFYGTGMNKEILPILGVK